jgi:hypothetical protein
MAASACFRFGCLFVLAAAGWLAAARAADEPKVDISNLPAGTVDFSKLTKGDPIEFLMGDKWLLGSYRRLQNGKLVIVRLDGVDHMMFPNLVRLPAGGAAPPLKERTWTDKTGKFKIQATLVRVEGEKVLLKRAGDGKEIGVALARLSAADHKYLKSVEKPAKPSTTAKASAPADAKTPAPGDNPAPAPGGANP